MSEHAAQFVGSIPELYDRHLGPVFFQHYAEDLAARVEVPARGAVLELACGTGIVTRQLLGRLPANAHLTATDLNQAMIDWALRRLPADPRLEFRVADAMDLPFGDGVFDRVVCQFGVMFFPDRRIAARESRRVLKPGGLYHFNVWGALEDNAAPAVAHALVTRLFPDNPPAFYQTPFGYHDPAAIQADLQSAGFGDVRIEVVDKTGTSESARHFAEGLIKGNPIRMSIEELHGPSLDDVVELLATALAADGGAQPYRGRLKALVVSARA